MKLAPLKPPITFADLEKIDIRVGTILRVEDVPGSHKLVRLVVDFGDHQRNILAGMKQERSNSIDHPTVEIEWARQRSLVQVHH